MAAGTYTDEQAQDAIGGMVSSEFTYNDGTPQLSINTIAQSKITNLPDSLLAKQRKINNYDSSFKIVGDSLQWRDYVNVKSFGAVGDGVTNNYTAFVNAVAAAGVGGRIYVPRGRYLVSSSLDNYIIELLQGQTLFGDGAGSVILTTDNRALIAVLGANGANDVVVENIRVVGSGKAANLSLQSLIMVYQAKRAIIRNVYADSCGGTGANAYFGGAITVSDINATSPSYQGARIENPILQENGIGIYLSRLGEYTTVVSPLISNGETGMKITAGNYGVIGGDIVGNDLGVELADDNNSGHGTFSGVKINHNIASVSITGLAQGTTFTGCMLYYGNATISNNTGVKFVSCDLYGNGTWTFTNNTKSLFSNCRIPKTPTSNYVTFTVASGEAPIEINNLDF